jgi:hypothetical protein
MMNQMEVGEGRVLFVQLGTQQRGRIRQEIDGMLQNLVNRMTVQ